MKPRSAFTSGMLVMVVNVSVASAQDLPRFNPVKHCKAISDITGSFEVIYNNCIKMEQEAYNFLKRIWRTIPADTRKNCTDVAKIGRGNYTSLQGCIEVKTQARDSRPEFIF